MRKRASDDAVWSMHRPLTPGDQERMRSWPSGGLVHVAHAFLTEALRREAYTMAISIASGGTPPQTIKVEQVEQALKAHVLEMVDKFAMGACQDALEKINKSLG